MDYSLFLFRLRDFGMSMFSLYGCLQITLWTSLGVPHVGFTDMNRLDQHILLCVTAVFD